METKEFKKIFGKIAQDHGFINDFGGWYKTSSDCIFTIDLQKSNYSKMYYLNMKIFIQGTFGKNYIPSKEIIINEVGNLSRRPSKQYYELFDLESGLTNEKRKAGLELFFNKYIDYIACKAMTKEGIKELVDLGEFSLFPAVKSALGW